MNRAPDQDHALVPVDSAQPLTNGPVGDPLFNPHSFGHLVQVAKVLADSQMIPSHFRGKWQDVFLALTFARQMGDHPLMVLQGLHVIQGKVGWSAQYLIARVNVSGRIRGPIRYREDGSGDSLSVTAYATLAETGEDVSFTCSMQMAHDEGWTRKNPKYRTMGPLMLRYRAATLLARLHFPDVMMGLHTAEEWEDVGSAKPVATYEPPDSTPPASSSRPASEASRTRALPVAEPLASKGRTAAPGTAGDPSAVTSSAVGGSIPSLRDTAPEGDGTSSPSQPAPVWAKEAACSAGSTGARPSGTPTAARAETSSTSSSGTSSDAAPPTVTTGGAPASSRSTTGTSSTSGTPASASASSGSSDNTGSPLRPEPPKDLGPAATGVESPVAASGEGEHHHSWEGDRIAFFTKLKSAGLDYALVCDVTASVGRARPSAMDNTQRIRLLGWLESAGASKVQAVREERALLLLEVSRLTPAELKAAKERASITTSPSSCSAVELREILVAHGEREDDEPDSGWPIPPATNPNPDEVR